MSSEREDGNFRQSFGHFPQSNCEMALEYARRRLPIVPLHGIIDGTCTCAKGSSCTSPGKHPIADLVPNGVKNATTNEEVIKGWFEREPMANIGVVTGPRSGIFLLEADIHDGVDGRKTLAELEAEHGPLPETLTARSGGGGAHYVFNYPSGYENAKWRRDIGPGVEIRASDDYYFVVAPSIHKSGRQYEWVDLNMPISDAPEWLVELSRKDTIAAAKEHQISRPLEMVFPSQRHNAVVSLAGKLLSEGVNYEAAVEKCLAFNRNCCVPPKTDQDVVADVLDIYSRYEPGTSFKIDGARQYVIKDGAYVRVHTKERYGRVDRIETPLCNFTAQIIKEIAKDDGAELTHYYVIAGKTAKGRDLPPIEVPADKLDSMQWISQWGVDAIVEAGYGLKDHLRAAIKYHSLGVERQSVYTHIGWRIIGNEYLFLHAGGAIGKNGSVPDISVEVGDSRLRHYRLPDPLL
ncbi:MAG: bifunctional DNA primase/polymerase, partial [Halobacteriota archaeon]